MLLDQNNREHIIDAFRPDISSSSFQRPVSDMNIASGCPLFCPLSKLDSKNSYIRDDTIFIKAIVDLTGLQAHDEGMNPTLPFVATKLYESAGFCITSNSLGFVQFFWFWLLVAMCKTRAGNSFFFTLSTVAGGFQDFCSHSIKLSLYLNKTLIIYQSDQRSKHYIYVSIWLHLTEDPQTTFELIDAFQNQLEL